MYTTENFPTKKSLREAVASGQPVTTFQPNGRGGASWFEAQTEGTIYLEGPHYPAPHKWYASCEVSGGVIVAGSIS
jgi:hypothetical protein